MTRRECATGESQPTYGDVVYESARFVGVPAEAIDRFLGAVQACGWLLAPINTEAADAIKAAQVVSGLYFQIAEEAVGADEVRRRFKERFDRELSAPSERAEPDGYPGIAHDLETLRTAATTIRNAYPTDPGTWDLDDEQPIYISTTLGAFRALDRALHAAPSAIERTGWVSVDTQLPPAQQSVLVLTDGGNFSIDHLICPPNEKHSHWYLHSKDEITYWCYIPVAPAHLPRKTVAL